DQQHEVLVALIVVHACNQTMLGLTTQNSLTTPDDQVVQQHRPDDRSNHSKIELSDPAHRHAANVGREWRVHMHFTQNKFLGDTWMALATCLNEVGFVDRGARIAGGEDIVHSMATGTVSHNLGT